MRSPCIKCGGEKGPGQGRRLCDDCRELSRWRRERSYVTRVVRQRQPCQACRGVKPPGHGRRYCDRCLAKRAGERVCKDCSKPVVAPRLKCDDCLRVSEARQREANRIRSRKRRARARAEGKATPVKSWEQLQRDRETRRLRRRELRAAAGKEPLPELSAEEYARRYGDGRGQRAPRVDAAPLVPWLEEESVVDVAFRAGIDDSYLYRVMRGQQTHISVRDADRLCLALGTTYADVYSELAQIA